MMHSDRVICWHVPLAIWRTLTLEPISYLYHVPVTTANKSDLLARSSHSLSVVLLCQFLCFDYAYIFRVSMLHNWRIRTRNVRDDARVQLLHMKGKRYCSLFPNHPSSLGATYAGLGYANLLQISLKLMALAMEMGEWHRQLVIIEV